MVILFGIISFVTNLAAPMGVIVKAQFQFSNFLGILGSCANFLAYACMGIPSGILLQKYGYRKTALRYRHWTCGRFHTVSVGDILKFRDISARRFRSGISDVRAEHRSQYDDEYFGRRRKQRESADSDWRQFLLVHGRRNACFCGRFGWRGYEKQGHFQCQPPAVYSDGRLCHDFCRAVLPALTRTRLKPNRIADKEKCQRQVQRMVVPAFRLRMCRGAAA